MDEAGHHYAVNHPMAPSDNIMPADSAQSLASADAWGISMGHMHMTFYFGPEVTLLIPGLTTHTWGAYAVALIFCFAFTVGLEALAAYRWRVASRVKAFWKSRGGRGGRSAVAAAGLSDAIATPFIDSQPIVGLNSFDRITLSVLSAAVGAVGYLVMLLVMSFNVGIFVAIVLGHLVGVHFFGMNRLLGDDFPLVECGCSMN